MARCPRLDLTPWDSLDTPWVFSHKPLDVLPCWLSRGGCMVPTHLTDEHRESGQNLQCEPPQPVSQQRQEHLIRPAFAQADPCSVRSQKAIRTSGWRESMVSGTPSSHGCYLTLGIDTTQRKNQGMLWTCGQQRCSNSPLVSKSPDTVSRHGS